MGKEANDNFTLGRPELLKALFEKSKTVDGSRYKVVEGTRLNNKQFQTSLSSQQLEEIDKIWKQNNKHLKRLNNSLKELEQKWEEETDPKKKEILFYKYELEVESFYEPGIELDEYELEAIEILKKHLEDLEKPHKD